MKAARMFDVVSGLQDDVVMGTLTVRENLNFSAALRLPASISQDEKEQMVDRLIQELGLGRVADSRVRNQEDRKKRRSRRKRELNQERKTEKNQKSRKRRKEKVQEKVKDRQ